MRTKALLGLAALAASALSVSAQSNVYSLNVVGYVNVNLLANKFAMLQNPLNLTGTGGNTITNVLAATYPDQTTLFKFVNGSFLDPETYYDGFGWFPGTTELNPGEGFFITSPSATTLTFVGEVVQGTKNVNLRQGYSMIGSPVAQSLPLGQATSSEVTTFKIPAADQDTVYRFDAATSSYLQPVTYYGGYGWVDPNAADGVGPVDGPSVNVAEAFFFSTAAQKTWTRSFTVQ